MGEVVRFPEIELEECKTEEQWRFLCKKRNISKTSENEIVRFAKEHNFSFLDALRCLAGLRLILGFESKRGFTLEGMTKVACVKKEK